MGLKTSLPPTKRLFVVFTIFAFVLATFVVTISPKADEQVQTGEFSASEVNVASAPSATVEKCQVDIAMLIDVSASMKVKMVKNGPKTRLEGAKDALNNLAATWDEENKKVDDSLKTQVALISFSKDAKVDVGLTQDMAKFKAGVSALDIVPGIGASAAFNAAAKELKEGSGQRPTAKKVIVIASDGFGHVQSSTLKAANTVKGQGIEIFAMSVGNKGIMDRYASPNPPQHYYHNADGDDFDTIYKLIAQNVCANTVTVKLQSNKPVIRGNGKAELAYTITNNLNSNLTGVTITQKLPNDLVTEDGKSEFTINVSETIEAKKSLVVKQKVRATIVRAL